MLFVEAKWNFKDLFKYIIVLNVIFFFHFINLVRREIYFCGNKVVIKFTIPIILAKASKYYKIF